MKQKLLFTVLFVLFAAFSSLAQVTPLSQMEKLDRGIVALPSKSGTGNFVSWRFLGYDSENTRFDLIRNGTVVATDLVVTNYEDRDWNRLSGDDCEYQVVAKVDGEVKETSQPVKAWTTIFKQLKLDRPATGANGGTYSPSDCSTGDVDGDGQYEIIVKWDPNNAKDNSQSGITDNVYIDCYKLDGTKLWRIDLGRNIRAGAHYTQFQVYDYDGDGKAEMMCKTAPGSLDGKGNYVNQAATEAAIKNVSGTALYRNSDGKITGGQEWLTVFKGETGEAIHTIFYNPNRNATYGGAASGTFNWDDRSGRSDYASYGNRGERYLAATAYLGGPDSNPSAIFSRGYYTYAFIWAVDFDGEQLHQRWFSSHKSKTSYQVTTYDADGKGTSVTLSGKNPTSGGGSRTMYGNGNHNLSIGDVDGDGRDEIIWGAAALDDDGKLLYATGFGHGDAIHLGKMDPDREGLQLFQVHESKGTYAWDLHDAATGEILWKGGTSGEDNGRGLAADIVAGSRGYEFWSSCGGFDASSKNRNPFNVQTGKQVGSTTPSMNFRIYWDGDVQDELLDGTNISKYGANGNITTLGVNGRNISNLGKPASCNGSKSTPCLSADLFGDWREELILWSTSDYATLNIYTTTISTEHRVPTLMHDHTYRMGICWQNTAYNQPPHLGYYLPDYVEGKLVTGIRNAVGTASEGSVAYDLQGRVLTGLQRGLNIVRQGSKVRKVIVP